MVVKQSFFSLSGQNGCSVIKAHIRDRNIIYCYLKYFPSFTFLSLYFSRLAIAILQASLLSSIFLLNKIEVEVGVKASNLGGLPTMH